ncbi:MAG: starch synthase [Betaproteobacteria bacterium RIFCSPLOWO2_02_FULL_66_14]|nr:MAG: starch synthase [Betaproteobacteria bacterium RIFCSPLOWO2_02_FULL_66_14]
MNASDLAGIAVLQSQPLRVLHVTPECAPWVKTGGLGDVSAALPAALRSLGVDVRVLLPAYRPVLAAIKAHRLAARFPADANFPAAELVAAKLPSGVPAWLLDCPALYDREGGPYQDASGADWTDNALRFGLLSRVAASFASRTGRAWRPQLIHCNDWQSGLVPGYLHFAGGQRPATLQCVHNLAFQGLFSEPTLETLGLPASSFTADGLEFFGRVSFLKAGLQYADAIVTVSPRYAIEIQSEPLGFGFQGLLAKRAAELHGIVNGIDDTVWDPARDAFIARRYDASSLDAKLENKLALQARMGLQRDPETMLLGLVARLTEQKGADLVAQLAPRIAASGLQVAVLGTGERSFERALREAAQAAPASVATVIGFDETLAHLVMAGADAFLMPSRFEPCGLNQMYGQRYGTPPIARATGGLCDTITDSSPAAIADGSATGFLFGEPTAEAFWGAVERARATWHDAPAWRALQHAGMAKDFGWSASASKYARLYDRLVAPVTPSS